MSGIHSARQREETWNTRQMDRKSCLCKVGKSLRTMQLTAAFSAPPPKGSFFRSSRDSGGFSLFRRRQVLQVDGTVCPN